MASNDPSTELPVDPSKKETTPESGENQSKSQDTSTEPTGPSATVPNLPSGDQPVQPVVDEMENIEPLSGPSSPNPGPEQSGHSVVNRIGDFFSQEENGPICSFGTFFILLFGVLTILINISVFPMPEVCLLGASIIGYAALKTFVKRGKWSREYPLLSEENKRNLFVDPLSVHEGNPLEPPCPRPQPTVPKVQVYQADVHHVDQPSTSSGAQGVDPKEGGTLQSSTPSTSGIVTSVDIHVVPQDTEDSQTDS